MIFTAYRTVFFGVFVQLTMGNKYCIMQLYIPNIQIRGLMQQTFFQGSISELLSQVTQFYSIADIATEFQVNQSTIHRWMNGSVEPKSFIADRLVNMLSRKISAQDNDERQGDFTFIDL
ncbi:MAG: hypothetical protein II413_02065, partial [Treponema sp.]|nr:hypothetical protein [Treponema sp.]